MFCNKCGTEIRKWVKFCPGCGTKIEGTNATNDNLKWKKWENKITPGKDEERITVQEYLMTTNIKDLDEARKLLNMVKFFFWGSSFFLVFNYLITESGIDSSLKDIISTISWLTYLWLIIITMKGLKAVNQSMANTFWLIIPICWLFLYPMIADPLKTILGIRKPPYRSTFTAKKSSLHSTVMKDEPIISESPAWTKNSTNKTKIVIGLIVIGLAIYWSVDNTSIQLNNDAMESFNNWDSQIAIKKLQDSKTASVTDKNKLNTLVNLAYVQTTESQNEEALNTFKEALPLTENNSFYYYLITAEIALLSNDPDNAYKNYNLAFKLDEKNFQINNALTIFHLDIEDKWAEYVNFPKALFYALRAYEYDWKSELTKQNLAIAYFFNGDYEKTISLLSTSNLAQHPMIWFWLALAYGQKGDSKNAKLYLQKAIENWANIPQEYIDSINSN